MKKFLKIFLVSVSCFVFALLIGGYFYFNQFVSFQTFMNENNIQEMDRMIQKQGYNVHQTRLGHNHLRLYLAANYPQSNPNVIQKLIDLGYNINFLQNQNDISDLMFAVVLGDLSAVKILIQNGADVNYIHQKSRFSVLDTAIRSGKFEIANYLIENTSAKLSAATTEIDINEIRHDVGLGKLSPIILEKF